MTALAGIVDFDLPPHLPLRCAAMIAAQRIYGDGAPVAWQAPGVALGKLAHRVLERHVDAPRESPVIVFADARIDNRGEISAALGAPPGLSDAALIGRAIERWGDDAIARLVGEFAIAWWHGARLGLARDFLGQRPLHLVRGPRFVAFASMAKGLHALPGVARAPDLAAVARALANLPMAGAQSFFAGIERVTPGHIVTVDAGGMRSRPCWAPADGPPLASADQARDRFRAIFDEAVAARLHDGGGRVASHLSAGLDSSAVAATAARLLAPGGEVVGFTAVPRGDHDPNAAHAIPDESDLAAETAALYPNMTHVRVAPDEGAFLAMLDRNALLYERPVPNLCNQPWLDAINRAARARDLPIVLSGIMGNLTFSHGGSNALPSLFARREWRRLFDLARALRRRGRRWHGLALEAAWPGRRRPSWRRGAAVPDPLLRPERLASFEEELAEMFDASADARGVRLRALRRVDLGNFAKGALAGWGVDLRDPTADRRLVELTLAMPEEMFVPGGVPRGFARDALADRLPAAITNEFRRGYQAADWNAPLAGQRAAIADAVRDMARSPEVAAVIDTGRLIRLVDAWPARFGDTATAWEYRLRVLPAIAAAHFIRDALAPGARA